MMRSLAFLTGLLSLAGAVTIESRQSTACNNSPQLCARPYSSITHLGAHDSPFVRDATTGYSSSGNQYYNSTVQLDAGVRLLTAQVHKNNGDWHLCHSSCDLLDAGLLSEWLKHIKRWLENNPNDVVTILLVNSDNATPSDLHNEFATAQITSLAYTPPSSTAAMATWPTLQTLISANTRLMVFVGSLDLTQIGSGQTYLMDEFTFIFENPYENMNFSSFTCAAERPSAFKGDAQSALASNRLPFMNHFLYKSGALDIETPDVDNVNTTNSPSTATAGSLGTTLNTCKQQYGGRAPTFVLVDFFDQGPAIDAVDAINGITPSGRKAVPPRGSDLNRVEVSWRGVQELVQQVRQGENPSRAAWIWGSGKWSWGGINLSGGSVVS